MSIIGKKVASGYFYLFTGSFIAQIISFAGTIFIARILGPYNYGIVAVAFSLPQLLISITEIGLPTAIIKYISSNKRIIAIISYIFRIIIIFIISILLYSYPELVAELFRRPYIEGYIRLLSLYIVGVGIYQVIYAVLSGLGIFDRIAFLQIFQSVLRISITLPLLFIGFGILSVIIGHIISYIVIVIIGSIWIYGINKNIIFESIEIPLNLAMKELLAFILPLTITSFTSMFILPYLNVLTARYVKNIAMGNYQIAMNLTIITLLLTGSIRTASLSGFSTTTNKEVIDNAFIKTSFYSTLIITPAVVGLILFSEPLIYIFYGSKYNLAPLYLSITMIKGFGVILGSPVIYSYFISLGDTKRIMYMNLIITGVAIPIGFILIPALGVIGTLVSLIIIHYLGICIILFFAYSNYHVLPNFKANIRAALPSFIGGLISLPVLLHASSLLIKIISIIVYVLTISISLPLIIRHNELLELRKLALEIKGFGNILAKIIDIELKLSKKLRPLAPFHNIS